MRGLRIPVLAVVVAFFPVLSWAQAAPPTDSETMTILVQQVKDLQKETRELRAKVQALEAQRDGVPAAAKETAPAAPPQASEQPAATESSPGLIASLHDLRGIQWRGFGELDYKALDQRQPELGTYGFVPGSAANFYTGDFGLFLTSQLTEKASVLAEVIVEEGDAQSYQVILRRMLLKYDRNEHLKFSFGRYQTNIGYYNWAFRSAAWLQTTADRPLVMEYARNGGLLPTQAIGVSVTGAIPSGGLGLNYVAEYGSSDTIRPDINGDNVTTDENNGNQVNVGFYLRPDAVPGLRIGASFYHDKISNFVQGPSLRYGQTIVNAHIVYVDGGIEFLNEGFLIRHAPLNFSGPVFNTPAFYSQLSRQWGHIRPFLRYQYVNASSRNTIYDDIGERAGPSVGARYDLNDYIAFKAQLDHTLRRNLGDVDGLHLQLAFTF